MRIYFLLAIAAPLIGCTPPKSEAAERAEVIAAGVNAITPKDLGGGVTMVSATASGAVVTLAFSGIPASEYELPAFGRELTTMACNDPGLQGAIEKDVDIRVEFADAGEHGGNVMIEDCP